MKEMPSFQEDQAKNKYWKYIFLVWLFIFIFLSSFSQFLLGTLGGREKWLLDIGLPTAFRDYLVFGGLALVLKKLVSKIFTFSPKFSPWLTVLAVVFIVTLSFFTSSTSTFHFDFNFFFEENFDWLKIFYFSLFFVTLFVLLISLTSKLLKIPQPNFWKNDVGPAIITYSIFIFLIPFLLASFNFLMMKNFSCQKMIGLVPQENCLYRKALKTNDESLCYQLKRKKVACLVEFIEESDPQLCFNLFSSELAQDLCFYQLAVKFQEKEYCEKIRDAEFFSRCQSLRALGESKEKGFLKIIHNFLLANY